MNSRPNIDTASDVAIIPTCDPFTIERLMAMSNRIDRAIAQQILHLANRLYSTDKLGHFYAIYNIIRSLDAGYSWEELRFTLLVNHIASLEQKINQLLSSRASCE
jgi:hypothetical protein